LVYLVGPVVGAVFAVAVAEVLRGSAKAQEALAGEGEPLGRGRMSRKAVLTGRYLGAPWSL
jgi:hypothetical protein